MQRRGRSAVSRGGATTGGLAPTGRLAALGRGAALGRSLLRSPFGASLAALAAALPSREAFGLRVAWMGFGSSGALRVTNLHLSYPESNRSNTCLSEAPESYTGLHPAPPGSDSSNMPFSGNSRRKLSLDRCPRETRSSRSRAGCGPSCSESRWRRSRRRSAGTPWTGGRKSWPGRACARSTRTASTSSCAGTTVSRSTPICACPAAGASSSGRSTSGGAPARRGSSSRPRSTPWSSSGDRSSS